MYVPSGVHDPVKEHLTGGILNKQHTECNCFSMHCNRELKLFTCVSKSLSFVEGKVICYQLEFGK